MNLQLVTMLQFPRVPTVLFTQLNPKSVIIIALHIPLGPLSLRVTILGKTTAVLRAQHLTRTAARGRERHTTTPRGVSLRVRGAHLREPSMPAGSTSQASLPDSPTLQEDHFMQAPLSSNASTTVHCPSQLVAVPPTALTSNPKESAQLPLLSACTFAHGLCR